MTAYDDDADRLSEECEFCGKFNADCDCDDEPVLGETFVPSATPRMCPECHAVGGPDGVTNCDTCYNGYFDQPKTSAEAAGGTGVIDLAASSSSPSAPLKDSP